MSSRSDVNWPRALPLLSFPMNTFPTTFLNGFDMKVATDQDGSLSIIQQLYVYIVVHYYVRHFRMYSPISPTWYCFGFSHTMIFDSVPCLYMMVSIMFDLTCIYIVSPPHPRQLIY
jgi:hypothetical protein